MKRICIVGLGLMGGSLALALQGFKAAEIVGVEVDPATCTLARANDVVDVLTSDISEGVRGAELVIFCVYAHHIPGLLKSCRENIAEEAVLTDICGVKSGLYEEVLPLVPSNASYVGAHPMAGKERDGLAEAEASLFEGTGFLICPTSRSTPKGVALLHELAAYIGATRIVEVEPARHDALIAYTSDLMHISAATLCMDYPHDMQAAFTAGAFRDSTRVADINAAAWAELLTANHSNVLTHLDCYIKNLQTVQQALACEDTERLQELLEKAGANKRRMLTL